jgi:hypothetical protein
VTMDSAVLGLPHDDIVLVLTKIKAWCAFFGRKLHPRMPLDPAHVRLKLLHACD